MRDNATIQEILGINLPFIVAPMFLVSNVNMTKEAMKMGGAACIPALNYRTIAELEAAIDELNTLKIEGGAFGINIIVNPSNLKYEQQLEACCRKGVDFIITSLGNPVKVIRKAHKKGIKVFCDVVNVEHAKKAVELGCDALIAVNNQAGGHRGDVDPKSLIESLRSAFSVPVISAGGISNKIDLENILAYGACGASIGSPFIASKESSVSDEYKQACVDYGKKDIVMTKKISGTPCTVINTPYVQKIGLDETWIEKILNRNKRLKKWVKLLRYLKGTKDVVKSATQASYKTVWVAGPSIEDTKEILPISKIIERFV